MKVYERTTRYSLIDKEKEPIEFVCEYDQPRGRRAIYLIAEELDKLTYKNRVGKTISRWVDKTAQTIHHKRGCNGDCSTMYRRLPGDPPGMFEMTPDRAVPGCGFMPPSVKVDLWLYDLSVRDRTLVDRYDKVKI